MRKLPSLSLFARRAVATLVLVCTAPAVLASTNTALPHPHDGAEHTLWETYHVEPGGIHSERTATRRSLSELLPTAQSWAEETLALAMAQKSPDHSTAACQGCPMEYEIAQPPACRIGHNQTVEPGLHLFICPAQYTVTIYYSSSYGDQAGQVFSVNTYDMGFSYWATMDIPNRSDLVYGDDCDNANAQAKAFGNPCDPASRAKLQTETDWVGPGGVAIVRHYHSQHPRLNGDHGWGLGWSGPSTRFLKLNSYPAINHSSVLAYRRKGGIQVFTREGSGPWQTSVSAALQLTQDTNGYTLTHPDGASEHYDTQGRLVQDIDSNGQVTSYGHNALDQVETITGPFGHTLSFAYHPDGHVHTVTDPDGKVISYTYDTNNNLATVSYPDSSGKRYHYEHPDFPHHLTGISIIDSAGVEHRHSTYGYNAEGEATLTEYAQTDHTVGQERFSFIYNSNTQATVTDAAGQQQVLRYALTGAGAKLLTSHTHQADGKDSDYTYDANVNRNCVQDPEGNVTSYSYNSTNQRISMTEAQVGSCDAPQSTPQTRTTTYTYLSSELDLIRFIRRPSVLAGSEAVIEIQYADANHPTLPTGVIQSGFAPDGTAVSRTVGLGYNVNGQVIEINGPLTPASGQPDDRAILDYYACTTGTACGQVKSITNALGHAITYDFYDANGRVTQTTDANDLVSVYAYDARGRIITLTQTPVGGTARTTRYTYTPFGAIDTLTTPDGNVLTYGYDAAQDLRSVTDSLGNTVEYDYDSRGNRTTTRVKDPDGTLVRQVEQSFNHRNYLDSVTQGGVGGSLTTMATDAVGNLLSETDPNNHADGSLDRTTHTPDALHRLSQTIDQLNGITDYDYDVQDNLTQMKAPNGTITDYVYDDLGNLLQETSPDRGTITYVHDEAGNVTGSTDARGIQAVYAYDALNRLIHIDNPGTEEDVTHTYDAATGCSHGRGRLCQTTDASGSTTYSYDGFGNVSSQTLVVDGVSYRFGYTYDAADRLKTITYPDGRVITYYRNVVGRTTTVDMTHNGVTTSLLSNMTYDGAGARTSGTYGNGQPLLQRYDLQGQLLEQDSPAGDSPDAGVGVGVFLLADLPSPQPAGKIITYNAFAVGSNSQYQYRFLLTGPATNNIATEVQAYSASSTFVWTSTDADIGSNTLTVEVRASAASEPFASASQTMLIETAQGVGSVTLSLSHASPQNAGTTLSFTAKAQGGNVGRYEYQFYRERPDKTWVLEQAYDPNDTFVWIPGEADVGQHRISVQVRNAGSTSNAVVSTWIKYIINSGYQGAAGVDVSLSTSGPQAPGTPITFTAQGQGGSVGNYEYQFRRMGPDTGNLWVTEQAYSTTNVWTWTAGEAAIGDNIVYIMVRNLGSTAGFEVASHNVIAITNTPSSTTAPVSDITITQNLPSPQLAGSSIVFTAQASGGTGNYQYWFARSGPDTDNIMRVMRNWSTGNTWSWTPSEAAVGEHLIQIRTRNNGSTASYEAVRTFKYHIQSAYLPVAGVALNADKPSPQALGNSISLAAQASGGTGSYRYALDRLGPDTNGKYVRLFGNSATSTYQWTPTISGVHVFRIYAKNAGATNYEAYTSLQYTITDTTAQLTPAANPTLLAHAGAFLSAPSALGPVADDTTTLANVPVLEAAPQKRQARRAAAVFSAVLVAADPADSDKHLYWVRSPQTRDQWLAVRSLDGHVTGQPDLFALLQPDGWHLWTREKAGQYTQQRLPARTGLTAIPGPLPAAVSNIIVSEQRDYHYDANGNLKTRITPDKLDQYGYDDLDRLNEDAQWDQLPLAHDYDANGNRRDTTTITYHPNSNRMKTVNGVSVTHDNAGNLTTDHRGRTYAYNQAGRLASITEGGQTLASYTYNARGLRTTKVTPQGTTVYHYDLNGNLLFETSDTGTPQKSYVWLESQPVAQVSHSPSSDTLTYLHTDHLNTPRVGTDTTGKVTWRWEGEAFGATLPNDDPDADGTTTTVNLRFPGQYYDQESGLHYNWYRYMDPAWGRYITSDPIGLRGGLNTYAYVSNNPLNRSDIFGLYEVCSYWSGRCYDSAQNLAVTKALAKEVVPYAGVPEALETGGWLGAAMLATEFPGLKQVKGVCKAVGKIGDFVDLTSPKRRRHILDGDRTGGGHRPGTGKPGKSEFPSGWSDDRIMHEISDVATDPSAVTRTGRGGRTIIEGTRDGVDIRVILDGNGNIVTGFPINVP